MRLAGAGAGGKKNAPASPPAVSWKESSADTGSSEPLVSAGPAGETPRAINAWMTSAVESGSVLPGVATVFGKYDQPPSGSCPEPKKASAASARAGAAAPCAARPSTARAVELVSGPD